MRQRLRWADGKLVKEAIDQQLEALLGPRSSHTSTQNKTEEVYNCYIHITHNTCTHTLKLSQQVAYCVLKVHHDHAYKKRASRHLKQDHVSVPVYVCIPHLCAYISPRRVAVVVVGVR